jgi:hypothetical protein
MIKEFWLLLFPWLPLLRFYIWLLVFVVVAIVAAVPAVASVAVVAVGAIVGCLIAVVAFVPVHRFTWLIVVVVDVTW